MPDADAVRAALQGALGDRASALDGEVLEYVASCLADDVRCVLRSAFASPRALSRRARAQDMEWGDDGGGAYDAVGEMLSEAAGGDAAVKALCAALAVTLHVGAAAPRAPAAPEAPRRAPVVMGALTADEVGGSLGKLARGVIVECSDGAEQDAAKASKRAAREEAKSRAAYEKHLAELAAAAAGDSATVVRNAGGGGQRDISLENLVITNGGEPLIEDGTLTLAYGRRYGMIGRNGAGKTTLLRAIAERQGAGLPDTIQVLHVAQEVTGDDSSVLQAVLAADGERAALLKEEAALLADDASGKGGADAAATSRLSAVYARLEEIDAVGAPARAAAILAGLTVPPEAQERPTKSLSGGWRMRVALARALFCKPDLLLLGTRRALLCAFSSARVTDDVSHPSPRLSPQMSLRTTWT